MKAFRITSGNQFVQQVKLEPGEHTFSGYIYAESYSSSHRVQLRGSAGNFDMSIPLNVNWAWQYFSVTFTIYDTMTALDLSNSSYPVRILAPMFETGNNASTHRPNDLDLEEELENVDTKYGEKVIELDGKITQTKEQFEIDYTKKTEMESYVDGVKTTMQNDYNSKFSQTAEQIALKASKEEVDGIEGRLSNAEGELVVQAGQIAGKVSQQDFNTLGQRVSDAEGSLTIQAGQIAGKVSQQDFNTLGQRVSDAEGSLTIQAGQIAGKVSQTEYDGDMNVISSSISTIDQKADSIELSVDNLMDDLEATGIKISTKEIEVVAPKFKIRKPNGGTIAVFDENINIDDDGNMRLKSLRTPFALKTQWSGVDFDDTPNVILTNFAGSGDLILPSGEKYNGQHINIIWDMFFNTDISPTRILFRLKPAGTGKMFSEKGSRDDYIRLSTHERVYIGLLGYWANGVLNWIVTDKVNRSSAQPSFKAGEVVYSASVLLGSVSVYENKIVGAPSMVSVASNIVQVDCPTIFVLNDSGSLISRLLDRDYIAPLVQTDEYTRAVVQDYNTTLNRFLLKSISRTNIASSSAAAQNPTFRFSLVAVRDFSQLYQNI